MSFKEIMRTECDRVAKQAQEEWDSGLQKLREEQKMQVEIQQCIMNGKALQPIEYKVIVKPDLIEETDDILKSAKAAGIALLDSEREKERSKQVSGVLISVGGIAFADFGDPTPKVGDKVYFAKYAGFVLKAEDGTEFRMMNDKDVTAVLV